MSVVAPQGFVPIESKGLTGQAADCTLIRTRRRFSRGWRTSDLFASDERFAS